MEILKGYENIGNADVKAIINKFTEYYIEGQKKICNFLIGKDVNKEELASAVIRCGYLELYVRSNTLPANFHDLLRNDQVLIDDIVRLGEIFNDRFIKSGMVKSDSDVVFNPDFGYWSNVCIGADADIYIDGTLYDFKCTKRMYNGWTEIAQVYAYYCLNELCKTDKKPEGASLYNKDITKLALYKGRYGIINYCDLTSNSAFTSVNTINRLRRAIDLDTGRIHSID